MRRIPYKYRQFLFFLIKLAIVVGAFYFIYQRTIHQHTISLSEFILQVETTITHHHKRLFLLLALTILNWFFEIIKWKTLVTSIKKISLTQAAKQSLGSLTASLFTPNRIGEYGAKAFYFYKNERTKVLLLNLISNSTQMLVTLVFSIPIFFIQRAAASRIWFAVLCPLVNSTVIYLPDQILHQL